MTTLAASDTRVFDPAGTASVLVDARRAGRALPGYPGPAPSNLSEAYACQDAAITLWGEPVVGWKVGLIPAPLQGSYGAERICGPVFASRLWAAGDEEVPFPVFEHGFAAVEAEYVVRLGADADASKHDWTLEEAFDLASDMLIAIETAGSPLRDINDLGPAVVVSDFGNNAGLILGASVRHWRDRLHALTCETFVNGERVGRGGAAGLPGGPIEALRFLLETCARRGRPLRRGDLVSTGAATGIHDVVSDDRARVDFGVDGLIACRAAPAKRG